MTDRREPPRRFVSPEACLYGALLLCALVLMPLLSLDFGVTLDEEELNEYGKAIVRFFLAGKFSAGFDPWITPLLNNSHLKGGLFDAVCSAAGLLLPGVNEYDLRHMVNSLAGWLAIFYASLLARKLFGLGAAAAAVALCLLSPGFLAHCMNNPKDIPFAAFYTMGLYALASMRREWPFVSSAALAHGAAACVLALNVRLGGGLLLAYAGVALLVRGLRARAQMSAGRGLALGAGYGLFCLAALALGNVFRPWIFTDPLHRFWVCLQSELCFDWHGFVLFCGRFVIADRLPGYYIPWWFAITTPLLVLAGLALCAPLGRRPGNGANVLLLALAAVFPVAFAVAHHSIVYDGQRHFLFVYPALAALAAGGWTGLGRWVGQRSRAAAGGVFLLAGLLAYFPLSFELRNHPNELVYFNPIAGGVQGAFKRYEMDYWGNSCRQAVEYLRGLAGRQGKKIRFSAEKYARVARIDALRFSDLEYTGGDGADADYSVELLRTDPFGIDRILGTGTVVYRVEADGVPLCVVKKGTNPGSDSFLKKSAQRVLPPDWF